ncbi:tyrosine-type recombinase/integrase [Mycolicibacillus koreensis]|uniref:Uncharacterized protein n=1 Tax=Mycolicibacillus koreensis TaxID=1069220 RepID=A0A7I7SID3_9MYCO|nr:site-specific integrase [Mycolicibacillus koreensis]OSC27595.1 hypothetical protein B8W67_18030 [Mycolicibacillus koreensis]BBY56692.1 DMT family permease [Mycolicibacillus koreensis]
MSSVHPYATKSGRLWEVRWRDERGRFRRKKSFPTKRSAQLWQADLEVKTARGEWVDPGLGKQTIGSIAKRWDTQQAHLKPTTRHNLKLWYAHHVEPKWAHRPLGSVKPSEVRAWVSELQTAGVGAATIERVVGIVRQLFDLAVEDGLIAVSPASRIKVPKRQPPDRPFLSHRQVAALADQVGEPNRLVIEVLAYTALRWGELAALRVQDFDMLRRRIHVRRGVTEVKGELVWSTPKTGRARVVPIPASLVQPLAQQMTGKARDDLVFTTPSGAVLRNSIFRPRVFNPAVKRCIEADPAFPKVTIHAMRRTGATLAIQAGATVKGVQTLLGHASSRMTMDTYSQFFDDDLDRVADAIEHQREQALRGHGEDTTGSAGQIHRATS